MQNCVSWKMIVKKSGWPSGAIERKRRGVFETRMFLDEPLVVMVRRLVHVVDGPV